MALSDALLPEFDQEMALTRKSLERAPQARFGWKPHSKSPTLGWLVSFLATMPSWAIVTLKQESLDLAPGGKPATPPPQATTVREVLATFDKNVKEARAVLAAAKDEEFRKPWSLLMAGKTLMTQPKATVYRSSVMSHMIHHRAQLGVYLRLCDVPVPAIYGPTADESGWGG